MELRQLRHLCAVLERGSFSVAATHLSMTQPALSKSIRTLEQSLGVKLLDRGPTGVRPTLYGEHLATYAELVLSQVAEAEQEIAAMRGARKGYLRAGAAPSVLRTIMPAAVKAFMTDRPNIGLSVTEGLNETLLDALRRGKLDVVATTLPDEELLADLDFAVLREEPIAIVCNRNHPLLSKRQVELRDLCQYGWVVPERHEPDRRHLDSLFRRMNLPPPLVAIETTSWTLVPGVLETSAFLSYMPAGDLGSSALGQLSPLNISCPTWLRTTVVVFRKKSALRPLLRTFMEALQNSSRDVLDGQESAHADAS